MRLFEAQPEDACISQEDLSSNARSYLAYGDEALIERLAELGVPMERLELPCRTLGEWFCSQVETRERSTAEMSAMQTRLGGLSSAGTSLDLSDRTYSLAFDVGLYLAEVVRRPVPSLRWAQVRRRRSVDYGHLVLEGFRGGVWMSLVRLVIVLSFDIVRGSRGCGGLMALFDIWSAKAESPS